jgi:hypothetical protein
VESRIARQALAGALAAGLLAELLLDGVALGLNVPILTLAVLALVTWFGPSRRPADPVDCWLAAVAVLASLGPALRTDPTVVLFDALLVLGGVAGWSLAVAGMPVTRRATAAVAALGLEAVGGAVLGISMLAERAGVAGVFARGGATIGRAAPVVRGIVIAVPVIGIFTFLFASADAVFGRGLEELFRQPFAIEDLTRRTLFVAGIGWVVGGMVAIAAGAYRPMLGLDGAATGAATLAGSGAPSDGWVDVPLAGAGEAGQLAGRWVTEALIVLGAVDLLFAAFAAVQVVYLFGGADTLAAIGMTYSDYARQGYFQLAAAVALAGLLLVGVHLVTGRTRAFLVGAACLLGLIAVILGSAALRLRLYQEAYGWTELRFYVAASILWLATATVIAAVLLWRDRMRWIAHGLAASAVAITLGVSAIGPHTFVTHENLARVIDPSLVAPGGRHGFDAGYAVTLGDDAVPELVASLAYLDARDQAIVRSELALRANELRNDPGSRSWQSWNLARERAREALAVLTER